MAQKKKSRFRSIVGKNEKTALLKRTRETAKTANTGNKWNDFFKKSFDGDKWKCSEGEHILDIIPYLAGQHDPGCDPDKPTWFLELWVHMRVGVNQHQYVCPSANYGLDCPVCDHIAKMVASDAFEDDEIQALEPKRRVIYNVVVYDSIQEEKKGVQIWHVSHHLAHVPLVDQSKSSRYEGGHIPFASVDKTVGKSVEFQQKGTKKNTTYVSFKFLDRNYHISDEVLDDAYILDEEIIIMEYDAFNKLFMPTAPRIPDESDEPGGRSAMGDDVPIVDDDDEPAQTRGRAGRSEFDPDADGDSNDELDPDNSEPDEPEQEDPDGDGGDGDGGDDGDLDNLDGDEPPDLEPEPEPDPPKSNVRTRGRQTAGTRTRGKAGADKEAAPEKNEPTKRTTGRTRGKTGADKDEPTKVGPGRTRGKAGADKEEAPEKDEPTKVSTGRTRGRAAVDKEAVEPKTRGRARGGRTTKK